MIVLAFVACAAAGTAVRALAAGEDSPFDRRMYTTVLVNVLGAFVLGWLVAADVSEIALGVGGMGALTTFSTLISQIECIGRERNPQSALAYAAATLVLGVLAARAGIALGS